MSEDMIRPTSRALRKAKNMIAHCEERVEKYPDKAKIHRRRRERAIAFLVTHRLLGETS